MDYPDKRFVTRVEVQIVTEKLTDTEYYNLMGQVRQMLQNIKGISKAEVMLGYEE